MAGLGTELSNGTRVELEAMIQLTAVVMGYAETTADPVRKQFIAVVAIAIKKICWYQVLIF